MASKSEKKYVCIRDKQLGKHENDITELKVRSQFKEAKINELSLSMKEMNEKLDNITEDIQHLRQESMKDDSNIDNRVTALENTVKVLKWVSVTSLSFLGVIVAIFSFSLTYLH